MKKPNSKATRGRRSLVIDRLEGVSKDVFKKYYSAITDLVGTSPGVYALYDGTDLYYVGKSTDLHKRVRHHLRDRHLASWTHFSLYLVRHADHIHEIESLLVRIANPKGNRVIPQGRNSGPLLKRLKRSIQERHKQELAGLFGKKTASGRLVRNGGASNARSLVGLVAKRAKLFRTYKGQEYTAALTPAGTIIFKGQNYQSATGAAKAVIKSNRAVNGWMFWYVRDSAGNWVHLNDLARGARAST